MAASGDVTIASGGYGLGVAWSAAARRLPDRPPAAYRAEPDGDARGIGSPVRNLGGELRTGIRPRRGARRSLYRNLDTSGRSFAGEMRCPSRGKQRTPRARRPTTFYIAKLGELVGHGLLKRRTGVAAHQLLARSQRRRRLLRQLLRRSNDPPCSPARSPIGGYVRKQPQRTQVLAKRPSRRLVLRGGTVGSAREPRAVRSWSSGRGATVREMTQET